MVLSTLTNRIMSLIDIEKLISSAELELEY